MVELADTEDSRGSPARQRAGNKLGELRGGCRRQREPAMPTVSRAAEGIGSAEGAETSGVSPNDNPRRRAPGTPQG